MTALMRVIAGTFRSRILKSLKGLALRPTSDRLRETLFNVLAPNLAGSRFVDLFAGTGAIGIEALSRGAAEVVFIENHAPAATLIRRNLESLGIHTGVTVLAVDALRGRKHVWERRGLLGLAFVSVTKRFTFRELDCEGLRAMRLLRRRVPHGSQNALKESCSAWALEN